MYVKNQYKNFLDSWIFCSLPVYKCGYYEDFIKCLGGGGEKQHSFILLRLVLSLVVMAIQSLAGILLSHREICMHFDKTRKQLPKEMFSFLQVGMKTLL